MLKNIFLLRGKNLSDLEKLNIFNYPSTILKIEDKDLIRKIIFEHDHGELIQKYSYRIKNKLQDDAISKTINPYIIDDPIHQEINHYNILTSCLNGTIIIGLLFEEKDNPYDYKDILTELLHDYLNSESYSSLRSELEIENLLISLFIGIRRYGDEVIQEKTPEDYDFQEDLFVKVFLFGIDEVGKSSFVRRVKTGKYDDNYFIPSREFKIDYIKQKEGLLALWDMPGQFSFRKRWLFDNQDSNAYIYMIDVANKDRFKEAKSELWKFLRETQKDKIPLIIIGNKVDKVVKFEDPEKRDILLNILRNEIIDFFNLNKIKNRSWRFFLASVKNNYNIDKILKNIFELV